MGMFKDLKNLADIAAQNPMPPASRMSDALEALNASDELAIVSEGLQGSAKVLSHPISAPEAGLAQMHVSLEVTAPGRAPYPLDLVFNAARMRAALMPGHVVPVKIDQADPNLVAIEWEKIGPSSMPNFDAAMQSAGFPSGTPAAARSTPAAGASPGGGDKLDRLAKLGELREKGVLTDAEFETQKAKILASE